MVNMGIEVAVGGSSDGGETGHVLFRGDVVGGAVTVCDRVGGGGSSCRGSVQGGGVEERWEGD